jgi:outer membrane receptor protein involved in Fe transport
VRKFSHRSLILLAPVFCVASLAKAEPTDLPDTIVVTATRIPTPEDQVASSITVVTADDIAARQLQTLPDVLKEVPGLNLVQTGGPGGQTSVFMRGTNSNHTKVLVDGIDVSDPSNPGGAFDFGQFLTQDIQKVEILRGPQSGLYGSDAIGGVINIITKSGQGPAQFNASAEAGSFDTFNQAAGVSGSAGAFHYAANLDHEHAAATPVTPLDLLSPSGASTTMATISVPRPNWATTSPRAWTWDWWHALRNRICGSPPTRILSRRMRRKARTTPGNSSRGPRHIGLPSRAPLRKLWALPTAI